MVRGAHAALSTQVDMQGRGAEQWARLALAALQAELCAIAVDCAGRCEEHAPALSDQGGATIPVRPEPPSLVSFIRLIPGTGRNFSVNISQSYGFICKTYYCSDH